MRVPSWAVRTGKALATVAVVIGVVLLPLNLWQSADFAAKKGWLWHAVGRGGRRVLGPLLGSGSGLSVGLVFTGVVLFAGLVMLDRQWRLAEVQAGEVSKEISKLSEPVAKPDGRPLLKAKGTNATPWPRVESAVDSLGHQAKRLSPDSLYALTEYVLRPGQQVTFELEASDPNGDDLRLNVITPGKRRGNVTFNDGLITWTVGAEDIADPAYVHIYVASQRAYHRVDDYDDTASFVYRVLPRL